MSDDVPPQALTPTQLDNVAALFKVLGEPMRLRILQSVCHGPRCAGDIVACTGATQPNVSKHLSLLVHAGILGRRKAGRQVVYSLRDPLVTKLCEMVTSSLS